MNTYLFTYFYFSNFIYLFIYLFIYFSLFLFLFSCIYIYCFAFLLLLGGLNTRILLAHKIWTSRVLCDVIFINQ